MKKNLPMLSLTVGLIFAIILRQFTVLNSDIEQTLPMLASLFMAELGAIVTAYAVFTSVKTLQASGMNYMTLALLIGNALLTLNFIYMGMGLWGMSQPG